MDTFIVQHVGDHRPTTNQMHHSVSVSLLGPKYPTNIN